jgi:hypothetical protein
MTVKKLKDALEPHYDNLDYIVDDIIRLKVPEGQFKFFDACRFKVKSIWYIRKRIEELDNDYLKFLSLCISEDSLEELSLIKNKDWGEEYYLYFPFFEAIEFENLLAQGKACLDCFSKAIGSIHSPGALPRKLKSLINFLESKSEDKKISKMLEFIRNAHRLYGVIIDPLSNKEKSLRDLLTHYERVDIFFTIRMDKDTREYVLSDGALVNMRHPRITRFSNYRVADIADKMWFLLLGIVENCFKIQFE